MMINIIFPQALKNILPALMNEFITLNERVGYCNRQSVLWISCAVPISGWR